MLVQSIKGDDQEVVSPIEQSIIIDENQ